MESLRISTNRDELDVPLIHRFLSEQSHWAKGISLLSVRTSLANSLCFGGYLGASQVAFGRVVTDYARMGYVMDVFVLPDHRGHGYGKEIVRAISEHPALQSIALMLRTSEAPGLYKKFGFEKLPSTDNYMRRRAISEHV